MLIFHRRNNDIYNCAGRQGWSSWKVSWFIGRNRDTVQSANFAICDVLAMFHKILVLKFTINSDSAVFLSDTWCIPSQTFLIRFLSQRQEVTSKICCSHSWGFQISSDFCNFPNPKSKVNLRSQFTFELKSIESVESIRKFLSRNPKIHRGFDCDWLRTFVNWLQVSDSDGETFGLTWDFGTLGWTFGVWHWISERGLFWRPRLDPEEKERFWS